MPVSGSRLCETKLGWHLCWWFVFAHVPVQEYGEILTRSIQHRTQRCDGRQICECWWIALLFLCMPCYYVYSNLVLFFRRIITQQTLFKHSFRTAICDFLGSHQVFSAQKILQRLLFVHCKQFLVDKAGRKRTQQDGHGQNLMNRHRNTYVQSVWACPFRLPSTRVVVCGVGVL